MDSETLAMIRKSIIDWCKANDSLIEALEGQALLEEQALQNEGRALQHALGERLFKELDALGLLHVWHGCHENDSDSDGQSDISLIAEAVYQFAQYSPGIALRLLQQNMASYLLAEAGKDVPENWVALPLYDAVVEWPFRMACHSANEGLILNGDWTVIPLLPEADILLLPVDSRNPANFKLAAIDLTQKQFEQKHSGLMLGLRGCSFGDISLNRLEVPSEGVILQGQSAHDAIDRLWSRAEICVMAIRSGILERAYSVARDYAKSRWQGGKTIVEHSHVRRMLADLYQQKCAMQESWQSIAAKLDSGSKLTDGQLSVALDSGEKLPWLASDGIQLLGGNGYMEDYRQTRAYRDAKQCELLLGHPQAKRFSSWQSEAS